MAWYLGAVLAVLGVVDRVVDGLTELLVGRVALFLVRVMTLFVPVTHIQKFIGDVSNDLEMRAKNGNLHERRGAIDGFDNDHPIKMQLNAIDQGAVTH